MLGLEGFKWRIPTCCWGREDIWSESEEAGARAGTRSDPLVLPVQQPGETAWTAAAAAGSWVQQSRAGQRSHRVSPISAHHWDMERSQWFVYISAFIQTWSDTAALMRAGSLLLSSLLCLLLLSQTKWKLSSSLTWLLSSVKSVTVGSWSVLPTIASRVGLEECEELLQLKAVFSKKFLGLWFKVAHTSKREDFNRILLDLNCVGM